MRVITGKAKGKRLKVPPGMNTRPVTDMIKEAIFNVIGPEIKGAAFLDLFAGSGSVGIEALSRYADKVIFIDNDRYAVKTILHNLKSCGFAEGYEVYRSDVFKAIEILQRRGLKFKYIYVDPPFTDDAIFDKVINALNKADILTEKGILIIRTRRKRELPSRLSRLVKYRISDYGESSLHYYCLSEEAMDR